MDAPNSAKWKWSILKYARLSRQLKEQPVTSPSPVDHQEKWENLVSVDGDMVLQVDQRNSYLTVTKDSLILESIFLLTKNEFLHVITKGDSILVILKTKDYIRKFRVQFDAELGRSGTEQCRDCVQVLSKYVSIKAVNTFTNDHLPKEIGEFLDRINIFSIRTLLKTKLPEHASLADLAKMLAEPSEYLLPRAYETEPNDQLKEELKEAVIMCMADSSFPAFVNSVEKCLNELTRMDPV